MSNNLIRRVLPGSFGGKILAAFIVVIVVVLTAYSTFTVMREGEKAKKAIRAQGIMLAELLAQSSVVGVYVENDSLLEGIVQGIAGLQDVAAVSLYNADAKLLYARDVIPSVSKAVPLRRAGNDQGSGYSVAVAESQDAFEFVKPVILKPASSGEESMYFSGIGDKKPRVIGSVRIVLSKTSFQKELLAIWKRNAIIMLIFIACAVAIVSLAVMQVTRPLKKLTQSVKDLGQGNPVEQVPVETADEIGNLASAFNATVAARLHTEVSLRESEKKFRMLTETAAAAIFISQDGSLRYLNATTEKLTGFPREELVRMNFCDIVHADYRRALQDRGGACLKGEVKPPRLELKILTKTGEERWVDFTSGEIEFEGRPAVLGTAYDVTERKKLEAQFLQSQKMEAVGLLAGGVAHDFNNMLTAITGYGYVLKMKTAPADPRVPYIEQMLSASERAANLTRSLLAFSRKQIANLSHVNANEVIIGIGKLIGRIIGEDIELKLELTGRDLKILADGGQIGQVLMNLATNARDAMPDGGSLTIRTDQVELDQEFIATHGFGKEGAYALLAVTDTGIGMADKIQERIFEPFFTTKEVGKGSGLGLSIVYGIVKQHEGFITAFSEPGRGTTFRIYLPLLSSSVDGAGAMKPAPAPGGTETVLLAEDNEAVRGLAVTLLAESGYTIIEAVDGADAVRKFRETGDRVDLLILDVIMPKKNGNEAFEEIRGIRPGIKVLYMSGYAGDIFRKKHIPEKDLNLIAKPIAPDEFLKRIRETLDGGPPVCSEKLVLTA